MRKFWIFGAVLWVLAGIPALAADTSNKTIHQDLKKLRKDYQAKVGRDLKDIGRRIKALKHEAHKTENKAKTGLNAQVKKLEVKKKDADKKFMELKESTDEAFKDLQKGMDDAVSDLKKAVDEASDSFKK